MQMLPMVQKRDALQQQHTQCGPTKIGMESIEPQTREALYSFLKSYTPWSDCFNFFRWGPRGELVLSVRVIMTSTWDFWKTEIDFPFSFRY